MVHFEWTPDLETGNAAIDEQHRGLFALANAVHDAIEADGAADGDAVADCVWRLTDYVTQHFADEQEMMEGSAYPGLPVHVALHNYLTGETLRMTARYMNGETVVPEELAHLITGWLREHIGQADKAFVTYLAER